ncbi:hypothetical protein, partial [Stenotrophomonas maltophilia]|uniref:hypothetical protein n=1 Tax=Stenotrophomonas maltophilia TaxID=40324 RepID=UPI0013D98FFB
SKDERAVAEKVTQDLSSFRGDFGADGRAKRGNGINSTASNTVTVATSARCVVDAIKEIAVVNEGSQRKRFNDTMLRFDRESIAAILRG